MKLSKETAHRAGPTAERRFEIDAADLVAPRISVCMATYNGSEWVAEQLDSIFAQLDTTDEVIIVDDASTDNTVQVVQNYGDPRIKLTVQPENQGYVKTFEHSLSLATGEFILVSDQDDVWAPGRVEKMVGALAAGADVVATNLATLGGPDAVRGPLGQKDWHLKAADSTHRFRNTVSLVLGNMCYWGCAMGLRRSALDLILPFPPYLTESHDLWIAIYGNVVGRMRHLEFRSLWWRNHASNTNPKKPRGPITLIRKRWMMTRAVLTMLHRRFRAN